MQANHEHLTNPVISHRYVDAFTLRAQDVVPTIRWKTPEFNLWPSLSTGGLGFRVRERVNWP